MSNTSNNRYVLQLCHGYEMPFLDVARQYATLFSNTPYKVITVYLTGSPSQEVADGSASDEVIFLNYSSGEIRGLKIQQIIQLRKLHKKYQFEFAIAHRFKPIYILQFIRSLPVIGINHAYDVYKKKTRAWFINLFSKDLYLIGVSDAIRDNIKKYLPRFPKGQIATLYNRVNVETIIDLQYSRQKARALLNLPEDAYIFANVGRLHPDKDQKTLIASFAKVASDCPNSILIIIGKGDLEQALKQQVQELDLSERVYFLGVIPKAVNYFRAFDSFILSSDFEPFGMVLLEAILADIPIIATNAGGAREIIPNHDFLFEVGDVNRLAELLQLLYQIDSTDKQKLTEQNLSHLQTHFTDKMVSEHFWQLDFVQKLNQPQ